MKKRLAAGLALVAFAAAGSAVAQIDAHHVTQEGRIVNGVQSGALTHKEVHQVQGQQNAINLEEARMRARSHGRLTRTQKLRLKHRETVAGHKIYHLKHNAAVAPR